MILCFDCRGKNTLVNDGGYNKKKYCPNYNATILRLIVNILFEIIIYKHENIFWGLHAEARSPFCQSKMLGGIQSVT